MYPPSMKVWSSPPSYEDVRAYLQTFFDALSGGKLEEAEGMVAHAYQDWNENVYNLFQDHYLIHESPPDSTFVGNWWKTNRAWLADISAQPGGEWMGEKVLWVDIAFRGEASGYIGEFQIVDKDGGFAIQHNSFRMA
jgi:hypothetical protein